MNLDPRSPGERRSIIQAYCAEFDRLATTLCDTLDVAARQGELNDVGEREALQAMSPTLERLRGHLRGGGDWAGAGTADALAGFGVDQIDEICRPAVEASVAEILDAGSGARSEPKSDEGGDQSGFGLGSAEWTELNPEVESAPTRESASEPQLVEEPQQASREAAEAPSRSIDEAMSELFGEAAPARPKPSPQSAVPASQLSHVLLSNLGDKVTLQGSAESLPISALFELLAGSRSTGCLHLQTTQEHLHFVFAGGQVVATNTDNPPPGQRLGEIIRQLELVDEEQLAPYVAEAGRAGTPLGSVLVVAELLSVEDLTLALRTQVHARFNRVLHDQDVAYAFVPGDVDESDGRLRVPTRELLFESARRKDGRVELRSNETRGDAPRGPARG